MDKQKQTAILAVAAVLLIITGIFSAVMANITATQTTTGSGAVVAGPNIGVYTTSACTTAVTSISWGNLEVNNGTGAVGATSSQTVWVENIGEAGSSMTLTISTSNWTGAGASSTGTNSYITITWAPTSSSLSTTTPIQQGVAHAEEITLTCTVAAGTPAGSFSCTITFQGTG